MLLAAGAAQGVVHPTLAPFPATSVLVYGYVTETAGVPAAGVIVDA